MQMSLEEAIGYVAADELIEASFLFLILQIYWGRCVSFFLKSQALYWFFFHGMSLFSNAGFWKIKRAHCQIFFFVFEK
jgi:hypothetical protein